MELIPFYFLTINAFGFGLMLADKVRAKEKRWRIPESTLMTIACLGGSLGCLAGMYTFRHKTRHPKFTIGIPVILLLQAIILLYLL